MRSRSHPTALTGTSCTTVDVANTIITHEAGSTRDQLFAVLGSRASRSPTIGWGKTTQLGYGLGLAMGAKLVAAGRAVPAVRLAASGLGVTLEGRDAPLPNSITSSVRRMTSCANIGIRRKPSQ
jgi:hypothetical protein